MYSNDRQEQAFDDRIKYFWGDASFLKKSRIPPFFYIPSMSSCSVSFLGHLNLITLYRVVWARDDSKTRAKR